MDQEEYRRNLNSFSDKQDRKRGSWTGAIAIIALLALFGVGTWGYYQNKQLTALKIQTENQYNRAFMDLTNYVDDLEVLLAKSLITSTPKSTSAMLEDVWRQANLAQENMGQLPVSPPILEKTSNYLTQVGDMAYALNTKTLNGTSLSDEEYQNLSKLHGYAVSLQKSLHGIENQINAGKMSWEKAKTNAEKSVSVAKTNDPQSSAIENIDKNFQEYPSLIYDGPYSDHMLKEKPLGLKSNKVSAEEAKKLAKKFVGEDKVQEIKQLDSNDVGKIKTFRFSVLYKDSTDEQSAEVDITQQGGQVYWMLRNRDFGKDTLTMEEAKKKASAFLSKNGFKNMKDTYYQKTDGTAVICYAYTQDNAIVYPDLVKVKIALDNGEIVGIESKGYLYNHRTREIPAAKLTIEQARKQINNKLKIISQGKAIIPTDFKTEKYCYEFLGDMDDRHFIIYINAVTGAEEDVLLLIEDDSGTLTM
ncbi:germination protein YpeB [Ruminiclostridium sufflavum DSM 19573]|uniref:Germination protein YpeB n=1 Tax=Ruminiclostridium sufflavum DSM 19573 TaxID=1121337 RepID=A0A318XPE2_9FIRM|nr:germination protein YpeB [Ruminiclostridium sufflavum]PYG89028.1 germination protein YpeB [Ruminiclostridium sufflavum DSM 19573]